MRVIFVIISLFIALNIHANSEYRFIVEQHDSLYYEVKGSGEPVLFLSGGPGGSPESLKPIMDYVSKSNYSILLHQRGTGLSSNNKINPSTITLNQYVNDIDNLTKKESIDKFYIIGHSWGAMLALEYVTRNPTKVKGLILLGSSGYSLDFVQSMNNEIFNRMTSSEMDSIKFYFSQLNSSKDSTLMNEVQHKVSILTLSKQFYNPSFVHELLESGTMNMKVNNLMMNDLLKNQWNLQKDLEKIDNPVVIINGEYDPIERKYVEALKQHLKDCELHFIEKCGHYLWLEKPDELQNIIQRFLLKH